MGKKKSEELVLKTPVKKIENGIEVERFDGEIVTRANIAEEAKDYVCLFGANKNFYRIAAKLQDGMKPGKMRFYWTWWEMDGKPNNTKPETLRGLKKTKVSTLTFVTMGKYHPHGMTATEEMIGREGQYWNNNIMCIEPQGNYGNLESADPAAGRYIKAGMSEYLIDCFFDHFELYGVPMKPSFEGTSMEPEYLPAKYPHYLFNPQISGIGYGMSSNIPPFNVAEVLDATIKLIKNPKAKILLIPDSPTGADIIDEGQFKQMNEKAEPSKVTMRASYEIDYNSNTIRFTSLPLQTKTRDVINRIIALRKERVFDEITEIQDRTKEGEVDLRIILRSDANPDKVLDKLFKKNTNLKMTYPVNFTLVDDYHAKDYSLVESLLEWIENREDDVRSYLLNSMQYYLEKIHLNDALCMISEDKNSNVGVKIVKESENNVMATEALMKRFDITSLQASTINNMRLSQFNKENHERYIANAVTYRQELEKIEKYLESDDSVKQYIIDQLTEGKKKYGRPRLSNVIKEDNKNEKEIPNTEHLIGISESGYIKKLDFKDNVPIGPVGKDNGNLTVQRFNNRDDIIVVDSNGRVSKISVSAVPDMNYEDIGVEIARYFSTSGKIIAVMKLPSMKALKTKDEDMAIIFVTKQGFAKRVSISEFKKITDYKIGITLNEGDEVAAAIFAFDKSSKDVIIYTNLGDGIRIPIKEIKLAGKTAKGLKQISLKDGEYVVNACKINVKNNLLFYITSSGRVKLTETKYFPAMQRKDEPLSLISLENNETLVGIASVNKDSIVMAYRKNSEPVQITLDNLDISTRVAKGVKVVKTPKGESVIAFKVFK